MSNCTKNRKYFFLAVNTGFVANRLPDERCIDFYSSRSKNGLHCAIVGNVIVPGGIGSNDVCAVISDSDVWKRLASSIAEQGARPGIQLSSAWDGYKGIRTFVPRSGDDALSEYREIAGSLTQADVRRLFSALDFGTDLAMQAGFRHIQLHAAHGYIFNLMADHRLSRHSDLALKLIDKWARNLASTSLESSIRLSLYAGHSSLDEPEQDQFVHNLASIPAGYFDISAGIYNINKRLIYPTSNELLSERHVKTLELAKQNPSAQFIVSGKSAALLSRLLPSNVHIGICRDLIANPDFLNDFSNGCVNSMKCHYYSREQTHITCGRWESSKE